MTNLSVQKTLKKARKLQKAGKLREAVEALFEIKTKFPGNREAKIYLEEIETIIQNSSKASSHPTQEELSKLATLNQRKEFAKLAVESSALSLQYPGSYLIWNILGMAYAYSDNMSKAAESLEKALSLNPFDADAFNNLGNLRKNKGEYADAISYYDRALSIRENFPEAITNRGISLKKMGRFSQAAEAFNQAIRIKSNHANAYNSLCSTLHQMGRHSEAIKAGHTAISINKNLLEAHVGVADAHEALGQSDKAISHYLFAARSNPKDTYSAASYIHTMRKLCDWSFDIAIQEQCLSLEATKSPASPFSMLSIEDNADNQLQRSKNWVSANFELKPYPLNRRPPEPGRRIRLGYFGADFHNHATMHLMSGLLKSHDHESFEVFIYSYGKPHEDAGRETAKNAADHFFDIHDMPDLDVLRMVRTHDLDIAIDLKGFTKDTKSRLFQLRLAPIQMNYLGFPGSMGAEFIDYIIADPIVIPDECKKSYSERIIYLPDSYQPNDNTREISTERSTKADFGLPEDAFVFCCFNNNYKITPDAFDIWMRILEKVEGSVLWLIRSNSQAERNLRCEAEKKGINPSRIVFAEKFPHTKHLERHVHADLFLDTFTYNAHTTASDALWSGLPMVSMAGEQFSARVGASLLSAAGLPELITYNRKEYEEKILELAMDPTKLRAIRDRLASNLSSIPLFDTQLYTRNFEAGLRKAYGIYIRNGKPRDIWV